MITRHAGHESDAWEGGPTPPRRAGLNFSTLDLNLLRVFEALLEERSATRAGIRLGLTQSAVSHALARLRDLLNDELFVKGPDGMAPTARARAIGPRLRAALRQLHSALADDGFDPLTAEHRFTVAADPYIRAILLPRLIARVRRDAPGVELCVKPGFAGATDAIDTGQLDLAIASFRRVPERFGTLEVLRERFVWAMRADHPAAAEPLTLDRLATLPLLVRTPADVDDNGSEFPEMGRGLERRAVQDDDGALARALAGAGAETGQRRWVRLSVPDSYAALAIAGETDLAALVPHRLAAALAGRFGLTLFDPPYDSPTVPMSMVWHPGHGASPAAEWLRAAVQDIAQDA